MFKNRKNRIIIAVAAACTLVLAGSVVIFTGIASNKKIEPIPTVSLSDVGLIISEENVKLVAHRGLSAVSPENTYYSVEKAGREGFTAVEIDIVETLDGVWVLMHDSTVNKMTDGRGKIKNQTYFELLNHTVNNGANIDSYSNVKIAELEEVLDLCAQFGVRPYIEIKQGSAQGIARLAKTFEERKDYQRFSVLSADKAVILQIKELSPSTELWYVADKLTTKNIEWLEDNKGISVAFNTGRKTNTDETVKAIIESGIKTAAWTVNEPETVKRLYAIGVEVFITDCILPR
jgi:glycerophosphoryl diester phosphodiesterase